MAGVPTTVSTTVLRAVPLFSSVPDEQLRALATVVTRKSVARGATIMVAGDQTDSLYIILSGRLKVMMSDAEGKEVILSILGPGEFFGEMGLIDDSPRSASVVAIEPCELLSIAKRDFNKCLADNFEITMAVMGGLVGPPRGRPPPAAPANAPYLRSMSYFLRFSGSLKTSFASLTSLKRASAFLSPGLLSG